MRGALGVQSGDLGETQQLNRVEAKVSVWSCSTSACLVGWAHGGGMSWYLEASQPDFYISRPNGVHLFHPMPPESQPSPDPDSLLSRESSDLSTFLPGSPGQQSCCGPLPGLSLQAFSSLQLPRSSLSDHSMHSREHLEVCPLASNRAPPGHPLTQTREFQGAAGWHRPAALPGCYLRAPETVLLGSETGPRSCLPAASLLSPSWSWPEVLGHQN